jgi:hypothetical protein
MSDEQLRMRVRASGRTIVRRHRRGARGQSHCGRNEDCSHSCDR